MHHKWSAPSNCPNDRPPGINLEDVVTKANLADAFALALQKSGRKVGPRCVGSGKSDEQIVCEAGGLNGKKFQFFAWVRSC